MKKVITICGSMKVIDSMIMMSEELQKKGFDVLLPNTEESKDYAMMTQKEQRSEKNRLITEHLEKIKKADAILVVNEKLKGIDGYIGANSFLEMGFAFCLGKKIFLLHDIPDQPNAVEIAGLLPKIIKGNVEKLVLL